MISSAARIILGIHALATVRQTGFPTSTHNGPFAPVGVPSLPQQHTAAHRLRRRVKSCVDTRAGLA